MAKDYLLRGPSNWFWKREGLRMMMLTKRVQNISHFWKFRVWQWLWRRGWGWAPFSNKTKTSTPSAASSRTRTSPPDSKWRNMDVNNWWNWMVFLPKKWATLQSCYCDKPGPTQLAVTHVQDIKSSFELFIPDSIQKIILDCSNLEGRCVFGERWKEMDQIHLRTPKAYFGVLILAGVFRSKGESTESLWDAETGKNLSVHQCLWKTSTKFPGLSVLITETTDQLDGRETS